MSTFVAVGNAHQPFARLLRAVTANVDILPRPILVQHGHTEFFHPECTAAGFVSQPDFDLAIRSEIVIVHAGAGSVLQCLWAGRLPIVMPRLRQFGEHVDDHQVDLAEVLDQRGRVKRIDDAEGLRRALLWLRSNPPSTYKTNIPQPRAIGIIGCAIQEAVSIKHSSKV
jgi:beta-1,4-N-acetylglucosaminyltransferase